MKRRAKAFAAAGLVIAAAIAVLGVWQRHELAERIALQAAAWAGLPQLRLKVAEWNDGRAVLTDIQVGATDNPDLIIDRLALTYDTASLRQLRAKRVEIAGLHLAVRWREGKLSVGDLDPLLAGRGSATGGPLPFETLSLADGEIAVEAPWGTTRIPLRGDMNTADGTATAVLRGKVTVGLYLRPNEAGEPFGLTARGDVGVDFNLEGHTARDREWTVSADADIDALTVHDQAVVPLHVSGTVTLAHGVARFATKTMDKGGIVELIAEGRHDFATAGGEAAFRIAPLTFASDRQPQTLLPLLRGQVTSVAGRLEVTGNASWQGPALTSGLTLSYSGGALSTRLAELSGVEAKVSFDSLWPLSTPPSQSMHITNVDVGVPLSDVSARFQLLPDGAVLVEHAGWPWAGGTIETRDVRLVPGAPRQNLTFEVRDVDLARMLKLFDLEGLEGDGRLEGRIPVEVVETTPYIRHGRLSTGPGGGTISYASEKTTATLRNSGTGGELLANALKNFHYTEVVMEIDGETTGPVSVRLHVAGANPNLYDGYPIELNINVEGDLGQLLRAGTVGSGITDDIRRQIEGRRLGEPK